MSTRPRIAGGTKPQRLFDLALPRCLDRAQLLQEAQEIDDGPLFDDLAVLPAGRDGGFQDRPLADATFGKGQQAIHGSAYGISKWDADKGEVTLTDVISYPAECVNPPEGVKSIDWIKDGMKGAKC